ncbi:MAG: hypothetical protein H7282_03985 [Cytophagaceae bacterium]|nr:hypothetical protein [Cytophagaceae bacterium]
MAYDKNGEFVSSHIKQVTLGQVLEFFSVVPNPGLFEIRYAIESRVCRITLFSSYGQTVYDHDHLLEKGNRAISINKICLYFLAECVC